MRLVHRHATEPSLPEMPGPFEPRMDMTSIARMHDRQCSTQAVPFAWHEDQVDMIGHQYSGSDLDPGGRALIGEQRAIELIIRTTEERLRAAIARLRHVMRVSGKNGAGKSGHGDLLNHSRAGGN